LDAYDSAQNARDLDAIRQALGYEAWNLLGISYGTRLALTAARDFPAGVRALVIDAVVPLEVDLLANLARNAQSAFEIAFAACQAEDECRDKYPNSMAQLETVFTTLTEEPLELEDTALTGSDFVAVLFNLLYSPVALGYVPLIIDAAAEGNFDVLQDLSANLSGGDFSLAMHLSVQCAEEAPFTSREAIASAEEAVRPAIRAGTTGLDYLDHCEDFPVPPAPARENQAVHSALPTLVFAGKFDPITPPSYSELAHQSLPNSFSFLIENESHGSSLGECGQSLVSSFLSDPTVEPSSTCLSGLSPPSFEGQRVSDRARRIGAAPRFATHSPSKEQIQAVRDDLEMRLHL